MLSQFGQKKKKEAVRRLSQNAARRQSLESRFGKRTAMFGLKQESMAGGTDSVKFTRTFTSDSSDQASGLTSMEAKEPRVPAVFGGQSDVLSGPFTQRDFPEQGQTVQSFSTATPFGMPNANPAVFGTLSASSSVLSTANQTTSVFQTSQAASGFPVLPTSKTSGFSSSGQTEFRFLVPSESATSSVGFPVSSPPTFGSFSSFAKSSTVGFPVSPVGTKPSTFGAAVKTKTSTGFPVGPAAGAFGVKSKAKEFSFAAGQKTQESEAKEFSFAAGQKTQKSEAKEFSFAAGQKTQKSEAKEFSFAAGQKRSPLKQTQTLTSFSSAKSFGTTQAADDKKAVLPDISKLKSLVIREIPPDCNNNGWLRRFYSRFGELVKVLCNPAKASATVTYKTHEAAKLAKVKGKNLKKGNKPVNIFWKQERKRTVSGSQEPQDLAKKTEPIKQSVVDKPIVKEAISSFDLQHLPMAMTSGDKYKVLEMIDSKVREGKSKTKDITRAKAVKGICPDMCPEKERYMREDRRRLHVFETIPGTGSMEENPLIDHARAVKEYDRSAADKEEPLPHELRPIPTLKLTMDYLVTNIMDFGEGRWADWFDFLWNRTRAIRKDITQQHLCDQGAVDLIEKTARFHIFCSHYLCDQDFGVFDPKINTENLTKCLQTLKHFYDDLYKNQNIICPYEAEFRAYDILLNLNEGDVLRQVMTYREEVRLSPIVKFAMEVFNALNSNNSVRFFRLVRSSNYLCACLLHRYFTQVRQQAIRILNYSLSVPNKEMSYPLSELAQMLAFEDDEEAATFCRFHGMTVSEPHVMFIRGSFIEPESAFPLSKSIRLIESKRNSLIGEIVYNGPLPPKSDHQPYSSFNSNGQYIGESHVVPRSPDGKILPQVPTAKFKGFGQESHAPSVQGFGQESHVPSVQGFGQESRTASVQGFGITPRPQQATFQGFTQLQPESTEPAKPTLQINIEELKEVTKTIFLEVINEMLIDITKGAYGKVQQLRILSNDIASEIEETTISVLAQEIAENTILDEQRQQIMKAQQVANREKASSGLVTDIMDEVIKEEAYRTASIVYNIEHQVLIQQCREKVAEQISQHILEQTVHEEVQKTVQDSFRELKTQRKSTLQQIANRLMVKKKERYFKTWIKSYRSLVRLKKLLSNFPAHSPLTTSEEQLSRLIGPQYNAGTCTLHSTRIFGEEQHIAETLARRQAELDQIRSEVLRAIDIPQLMANTSRLHTAVTSCMDWKLLLSFPGPCQGLYYPTFDEHNLSVSNSLVREKFKKGPIRENDDCLSDSLSNKVEVLSLYSTEIPSLVRKRCHICTLASYGVLTDNEITELTSTRQLQGTSAIIIVTDSNEVQSNSQELRIRVERLLQSKQDVPAIPAVVLFLESPLSRDHVTQETIIDAIGVHDQSHRMSEVSVARLSSLTDLQTLNDVLKEAITWLLQRSYRQLKLETNSLKNFVEEGVQEYFFTSLYDDISTRRKAGLSDQCPEAVIALYNAVIEHLAAVASSSKLGQVSWPVKEFCKADSNDSPDVDWNSEASLSSLNSLILSLCLAPPPPRAENGLWDSEALLCQHYTKELPQNSVYLTQRIGWLLQHKHRSLQASRLSAAEVPWTQVIEACISSVLTSLHSDPVLYQTEVYFFGEEMEAFEQPEIWREASLSSKEERTVELEKKRIKEMPSPKSKDALIHESVQMIDKDLDMILNNSKKSLSHKKKQTTSIEDSIVELKGKLGAALQEARNDIISFEEDLQRWMPGKRKADTNPEFQNPLMKSSRHGADKRPSTSS